MVARRAVPSLLWLSKNKTDSALTVVSALGLALSVPCALGGALHGGGRLALITCYALYASISNVGGPFYGYGWESQLLETAALCALPSHPEWGGVLALRWLAFKIMLGAGLIKLRARGRTSDGWHDLTAMTTFFETQPLPSPMSRRCTSRPDSSPLCYGLEPCHRALRAIRVVHRVCVAHLTLQWVEKCRKILECVFYGLVHVLFQVALIGSGNRVFSTI